MEHRSRLCCRIGDFLKKIKGRQEANNTLLPPDFTNTIQVPQGVKRLI
jgi:hypothetical protein